jgi:hypothetical protein
MPEAAGVLVVACPTAGLDYRIIHHGECPNLREYVSANALRWASECSQYLSFLVAVSDDEVHRRRLLQAIDETRKIGK